MFTIIIVIVIVIVIVILGRWKWSPSRDMIPSTLSSPTAVTSGMDTMTLRFIMAMMMLMVKTMIMNWGLHVKFWLSLEDNRPLWWKGVVRPRDLRAALGRGGGSADGSACGSSFYQVPPPSLSFGQLLFKMTPQRHYFLVDGASKEIFFCSGIPWACSPTNWRRMEIMMRWRISVRYGIWKYQNSLLWDNSLIQIFLLTRVQNKNNKNWARKDLELILIPWFKY